MRVLLLFTPMMLTVKLFTLCFINKNSFSRYFTKLILYKKLGISARIFQGLLPIFLHRNHLCIIIMFYKYILSPISVFSTLINKDYYKTSVAFFFSSDHLHPFFALQTKQFLESLSALYK